MHLHLWQQTSTTKMIACTILKFKLWKIILTLVTMKMRSRSHLWMQLKVLLACIFDIKYQPLTLHCHWLMNICLCYHLWWENLTLAHKIPRLRKRDLILDTASNIYLVHPQVWYGATGPFILSLCRKNGRMSGYVIGLCDWQSQQS